MSKTVLITGASKGVGRAAAELFASKGWNVVATMRSPDQETELTQRPNVLVTALDIEDPSSIARAVQQAQDKFGRIDLLVNNAGFGQYGPFEAITPAQIQKQFDVNVFGTMNAMRAVLPHFRAEGGGTIINVSSAGGRIGIPLISMYVASKFALEGFSEAVSYELASQNIVLKLVEPGGIATPFHETAAARYATDAALTDYDTYVAAFNRRFAAMHEGIATASQVAETIYTAATDGQDTLRYVVGEDAKGWIAERTRMNDSGHTQHMRAFFKVD
ncbi:MAG: SDR family oxidoreductase [Pseudomonadota bacterium]|nr:SDR family oxidoreductase [Pseudomonadota bacterium]